MYSTRVLQIYHYTFLLFYTFYKTAKLNVVLMFEVGFGLKVHPFSTYVKFSGKLKFVTP